MKKFKGFKRLKGLAAASAVGLAGLLGGGSARAASTNLGVNVTRGGVIWGASDTIPVLRPKAM